ncbi:ligase-associated DNA damage response exonuclease [Frigoriflavimonas asaccharolytica]|uniref:Putative mRNA 3-end processing factor n=1 Tax=Frigoriflavimonas asaccharolytica TaxID=2735899 RepID=A0A8J8G604_9FLAO|nr:ligase-associated DNA damage response exonuclease [Frigoriflavimonas asaccharolytica]NRS91763.1 putative mRNA 3-end processing factor [Frigoriflavimonas asaccharolytica]
MNLIKFTTKGIYCIPGKFYLDPWRPVDLAVITHGHGDHAKWGMKKYLCHHFTKPILKIRIGEDIECQSVGYNEPLMINGVKVSFHPAGHIVGSSQIRMEYKGYVTVFTGDYKVQDDGISTPFELVKCHEFITESTFGLPIYNWLTPQQYSEQMQNWIALNKSQDKTSVFIGYSLGKAQRILKSVEGAGKVYVHSSIGRLNEAIESVGIDLPDYEVLDFHEDVKKVKGEIVIVPPALSDSNMIRKIPNRATAFCSGWMQIRGSRRWKSADAGFAISDHADWNGLLDTIKATGAEKVHVTHGQIAVFTKYLNEIGINAFEVNTKFGDEEEASKETEKTEEL